MLFEKNFNVTTQFINTADFQVRFDVWWHLLENKAQVNRQVRLQVDETVQSQVDDKTQMLHNTVGNIVDTVRCNILNEVEQHVN